MIGRLTYNLNSPVLTFHWFPTKSIHLTPSSTDSKGKQWDKMVRRRFALESVGNLTGFHYPCINDIVPVGPTANEYIVYFFSRLKMARYRTREMKLEPATKKFSYTIWKSRKIEWNFNYWTQITLMEIRVSYKSKNHPWIYFSFDPNSHQSSKLKECKLMKATQAVSQL